MRGSCSAFPVASQGDSGACLTVLDFTGTHAAALPIASLSCRFDRKPPDFLAEFSKFLEYPKIGKLGNKRKYPSRPLCRHIMANACPCPVHNKRVNTK